MEDREFSSCTSRMTMVRLGIRFPFFVLSLGWGRMKRRFSHIQTQPWTTLNSGVRDDLTAS